MSVGTGHETRRKEASIPTSVFHELVELLQEVVPLLWVQLLLRLIDRQTDRLVCVP